MKLFGINKAIQYIEKELTNIEFARTKEDIRKHGTNALVLTEKIIKELLHIYGYLLFKEDYKNHLKSIIDLDESVMFGKALNALNRMHYFLKDRTINERFNQFFDRNFIVFKYNDRYFEKLMDCSRVRGALLHDDLLNINSLEEYRLQAIQGMNKALDTLKYFKENNIFPSIIALNNYYIENDRMVFRFNDDINSIIPIIMAGVNPDKIKKNNWYLFRKAKKEILIPTFTQLNPLAEGEIEDLVIKIENLEEKTVAPLGCFTISDREEIFAISEPEISIGRSDSNLLQISRRSVSRRHCLLKVKNNKIFLQDLGSKFGTLLNGTKITPLEEYLLKVGDEITIGVGVEEVKLKYTV